METLYNRSGQAFAYLWEDNEHIYTYSGEPIAFVRENFVYGYNGRYLGWIQNGWYYDRNGQPTFFTEHASGGPVKPARSARPARGARYARPAKAAREARPARPARSLNWSLLSDISYFKQ